MFKPKYLKRFAIVLTVPVLALFMLITAPAKTGMEASSEDQAGYYKSKCLACHGAKADKKFDTSLTDEQLVEAILKGKKAEKPPHMPEYETKGVNEEQAKALVEYMKKLREAAQ